MISFVHRDQFIRICYFAAFALFIMSLFVPAVLISRNGFMRPDCAVPDKASGWFFLMMGPLGVLVGQFGWFANPLMLLSVLPLTARGKLEVIFALAAVLLVGSTSLLTYIPNDVAGNKVCGFGIGLYLWQACAILLAAMAVLRWHERNHASR